MQIQYYSVKMRSGLVQNKSRMTRDTTSIGVIISFDDGEKIITEPASFYGSIINLNFN